MKIKGKARQNKMECRRAGNFSFTLTRGTFRTLIILPSSVLTNAPRLFVVCRRLLTTVIRLCEAVAMTVSGLDLTGGADEE